MNHFILHPQRGHLNLFARARRWLNRFNKQSQWTLNAVTSIYTQNNAFLESSPQYQISYPLLDDFDDGILICDEQMNVQFVNRSMFHLFGRDEDEISEPNNVRAWLKIPHGDDVHAQIRHVIEQKYERKDGSTFIGELSIKRIVTQNNPSFIMKMRDVTEVRAIEKNAITAQKLESLGVLAGGIAHDFNNMLTAILGQTSIAIHKLQNGDDATKHLEKAMVSTQEVADLTEKMLIYSGHSFAETTLVSLHDVIRPSLGINPPLNCQISVEIEDDLPLVDINQEQIRQAIVSIVVNAVEALDGKPGEVVLTVGKEAVNDEQIQTYCQSWMSAGQYIKLEIQDNGRGMDEKTLARIFDPFFSTKQMSHGLGLSAVIGTMRTHDGRITVDSAVGQGTTFTLYLPVPEQPKQNSL